MEKFFTHEYNFTGEVSDIRLFYSERNLQAGTYSGWIKSGLPNGAGNLKFDNGEEYFGEFVDGIIAGKGVWTEVNGDRYNGLFEEGMRCGFGKMSYSNGEVYEGNWYKNIRSGDGKFYYPWGDVFEGHWLSNKREGKGKLIRNDGDIIYGEWIDDKWHIPDRRDPLFEEAARLVVHHQQGSTSLVQRKLLLGYSRAGKIMDQLEAEGIIGPFEGASARKVLFSDSSKLEEHLRNI